MTYEDLVERARARRLVRQVCGACGVEVWALRAGRRLVPLASDQVVRGWARTRPGRSGVLVTSEGLVRRVSLTRDEDGDVVGRELHRC